MAGIAIEKNLSQINTVAEIDSEFCELTFIHALQDKPQSDPAVSDGAEDDAETEAQQAFTMESEHESFRSEMHIEAERAEEVTATISETRTSAELIIDLNVLAKTSTEKVKALDWRPFTRRMRQDGVSIVNADSQKLDAVQPGFHLCRSYWSDTVSAIEFAAQKSGTYDLLQPKLDDFTTLLKNISSRFEFRDKIVCGRLPSRAALEERLISPAYTADTAYAFARAKQIAPGVLVLNNLPPVGVYIAAEVFPIVLYQSDSPMKDKRIEAVFLNDYTLDTIGALSDVIRGIWSEVITGSLKDNYAEARAAVTNRITTREKTSASIDRKDPVRLRGAKNLDSGRNYTYAKAETEPESPVTTRITEAEYEALMRQARVAGQVR